MPKLSTRKFQRLEEEEARETGTAAILKGKYSLFFFICKNGIKTRYGVRIALCDGGRGGATTCLK